MAPARKARKIKGSTGESRLDSNGGDWLQAAGESVRLAVRVQPGSSRSAIENVVEGRLRVRVQAPPVEGAANEAVCRLFAKTLRVAKSKVRIVRGDRSREKTIDVAGLSVAQARAILEP